MSETTLLIAFIAVTAVAVVIQTVILAGVGIAVMQMGKRMQAMQSKVNDQVLPMMEKVHTLVDESVPKLQTAVTNLTESTAVIRSQADKIDGAVTHVVGIVQNQASRMDLLATRTLERVDATAAKVQHTVNTPIRRISAVIEGVAAGVGSLTGKQKNGPEPKTASGTGSNEEMFI